MREVSPRVAGDQAETLMGCLQNSEGQSSCVKTDPSLTGLTVQNKVTWVGRDLRRSFQVGSCSFLNPKV